MSIMQTATRMFDVLGAVQILYPHGLVHQAYMIAKRSIRIFYGKALR